jgi:hypothetical protein
LPDQDLYTNEQFGAALEQLRQQHYRQLGKQEQTHQTTFKILVIIIGILLCFCIQGWF